MSSNISIRCGCWFGSWTRKPSFARGGRRFICPGVAFVQSLCPFLGISLPGLHLFPFEDAQGELSGVQALGDQMNMMWVVLTWKPRECFRRGQESTIQLEYSSYSQLECANQSLQISTTRSCMDIPSIVEYTEHCEIL